MTRYCIAWYTLRTHLYEFDYGVTVIEMWVISKELMNRQREHDQNAPTIGMTLGGLVSVMLSSEACLHETSNSNLGPLQSCE
jgi:hypothetical protein